MKEMRNSVTPRANSILGNFLKKTKADRIVEIVHMRATEGFDKLPDNYEPLDKTFW